MEIFNKILSLLKKDVVIKQQSIEQPSQRICKISELGKQFIIVEEGKKNKKYIDSEGYSTIGIGHKIEKDENIPSIISDDIIQNLFNKDITRFETALNNIITANLTQNQYDALMSLVFNCGEGGLKKCKKALAALNDNNMNLAAYEFFSIEKGVNKAKGKPNDKLALRRLREYEIWKNNKYILSTKEQTEFKKTYLVLNENLKSSIV